MHTFVTLLLLLTGALANAQAVHPKPESSVRIMTYNVKNCTGMDNVTDYRRVAAVISRVQPDVVALQELDSATVRSRGAFVLQELAERTQLHGIFAPAIDFQGGKYGVGLLSKEKPLGFRQASLPGEEKRTLLIVEFSRYIVCCTHLDTEQESRERAIPIILEAVKNTQKPLILAGDMNAEYRSPELAALGEKFTLLSGYSKGTFPADKPNQCIDFIYGYNSASYAVLTQSVLNEPVASDHRPLYVELRVEN
jgi:endonuclease/exonuclease/phosphatase family metal-dependent hydrolase